MNLKLRMANFINLAKNDSTTTKIINDFKSNTNVTLHWVLCKFIESNSIR
jgi:hypothetical protein